MKVRNKSNRKEKPRQSGPFPFSLFPFSPLPSLPSISHVQVQRSIGGGQSHLFFILVQRLRVARLCDKSQPSQYRPRATVRVGRPSASPSSTSHTLSLLAAVTALGCLALERSHHRVQCREPPPAPPSTTKQWGLGGRWDGMAWEGRCDGWERATCIGKGHAIHRDFIQGVCSLPPSMR